MDVRVALPVLGLSFVLLLSGCLDGAPEKPADPERVAEMAIRAFGSAAGTSDGGDIKRMDGTFMVKETGEDAFMPMTDTNIEMLFEWGRGDIVHIQISMASGGMTMRVDVWCTPDGTFMQWGNTVYGGRPSHGAAEEDEMCGDMSEMEQPAQGLDMFDAENFDGLETKSITVNDDGTITAVFYDPEEEGTITATVDAKGRVSRIAFDTAEAEGVFDITYGSRDAIDVPAPNERIPAQIAWHTEYDNGVQTLTISSSPNLPPLAEIEARLQDYEWEEDHTEQLASFPTSIAGPQQHGEYAFQYHDHDGDGRVSENDTMTFSHPAWTERWSIEEQIELYDLWADAPVNESFAPGPGMAALLGLALVGLAFVARRRH